MRLEDAIHARNELNGGDIGGSIVKIGFAKVPSKSEPPLSHSAALASPQVMAGLAAAAMDRLNTRPTSWSASTYNSSPQNRSLSRSLGSELSQSRTDRSPKIPSGKDSRFNLEASSNPILPIPDQDMYIKVDQTKLREIRKKLETHISSQELEKIFYEVIDEAVDLCRGTLFI